MQRGCLVCVMLPAVFIPSFSNLVCYDCSHIESFKSAIPYFLGCRPNYTSQALSISCTVKIRHCMIYGSARKSYLQMLDPIHNEGLRLALGALRNTPVASLYEEADEPSLHS